MRIFPLSDSTGYYIVAKSGTTVDLWKYLFSSPSTASWQPATIISTYGDGSIMLNDNQLLLVGFNSASLDLKFLKVTFGSTSVDWSSKISCTTGGCTINYSESILSSDSSMIYWLTAYQISSYYLFFTTFNSTDGSVIGSRYRSSVSWLTIFGSGLYSNYIAATIQCYTSSNFVMLIDISSFTFTIRYSSK